MGGAVDDATTRRDDDDAASEETTTGERARPAADDDDEEDEVLPQVGEVLANKYRIESLIGRGGMGAVYAAQHELLCERVVLKVILASLDDADARARFMNEARASFQIKSEHVARVLDVDFLDSGKPFMVLEYLEGTDLAQLLHSRRGKGFEPSDAVDYILQALDALAAAHALGIVHRDLKPANLFLVDSVDGRGRIKVLDFGIAKAKRAAGDELTVTRMVLGTPQYMSPEQFRNARSVDAQTDIWAIGVILFELLTSKRPFVGGDHGVTYAVLVERPAPSVVTLAPAVPLALASVVERCLRRDPKERFADVCELAHALAPFASSPVVAAPLLVRIEESLHGGSARRRASPITPSAHMLAHGATQVATPPVQTGGARQPEVAPRRRRSAALPAVLGVGAALLLTVGALALTRPAKLATATVTSPSTSTSTATATASGASGGEEPAPSAHEPVVAPSAASARPTKPKPRPKPRPTSEFDPTAARKL